MQDDSRGNTVTHQRLRKAATATATFFAVPWGAFVVAFLYYVGLTLVAISVDRLPDIPMAAAYLMPVAAYVVLLLSRVVRGVALVPVEIEHWALPRLQ